jgi:hypothetical protein
MLVPPDDEDQLRCGLCNVVYHKSAKTARTFSFFFAKERAGSLAKPTAGSIQGKNRRAALPLSGFHKDRRIE